MTTNNNFSQTAAFIWSVADLLRGDFKQSQYGRVILPFTLLRRLECVLAPSKDAVVAEFERIKALNLPEDAQEKLLIRATNGLTFFNISPMDLGKMGQGDIKANLERYIQCFSADAREIFEHFKFDEFIGLLDDANLLFKVVKKFATTDLSPQAISNHDMGLVFEELNPESYAICKADMLIKGQDVSRIKLGNTLSNDQLAVDKFDYMLSNPPFGVDWKKIEGDIKDEHTLKGFDGRFGAGLPRVSDGSLLFLMHLISKMRDASPSANDSNSGGRIGIILNGSPLFTGGAGSGESEIRRYILESDLLEAIVALPTDMFYNTGIATYVWVLSNKKAQKQSAERKNKVQLINGTNLCGKMRKSLGSKRNIMSEDDIKLITRSFGNFEQVETTTLEELGLAKPTEAKSSRGRQAANPKADVAKTFTSKIFNTYEFGYRRTTIERPLRLSAQVTDEAIASLRFAPKPYNAAMMALYEKFGTQWTTDDQYGDLSAVEVEARAIIKADFPELKEKQIKDVLEPKLWLFQKVLMGKAQQLQTQLGDTAGGKQLQSDDFNQFDITYTQALKALDIKLDSKEKKQLLDAITFKNPAAECVVDKLFKDAANPMYGAFEYQGNVTKWQGKVVIYKQDGDLCDNENVPLKEAYLDGSAQPSISTTQMVENYFNREVAPHVSDAWINDTKRDDKDGELGIVGYEIPFNRHFYEYQPPRDLTEIDEELDAVSSDIMKLLQEVHS
ncbi:N-6 DNA methylase [Pseudoalteromonas sp. SWXJZ94C]|uniref:type I restriction-modification system subunit M n=1 Tax=Pseudoalteromonas sp. SWXJZ94C TaxID=2792065 RepID=UPI0018CD86C9|nr:type I restriction-modification system subunit M [Pseudoalteromonas sp. SWXJZ94C]MBH0057431.1 N-6 DNA methylase [Pseudoalteromonas sp. SWXJZ94C]